MSNTTQENTGTIISIQLCPGYRKPMQPVQEAALIENIGIAGDKHALPDSGRQVLLLEKETLDAFGLEVGQIKENITVINFDLMGLKRKQRIQIGGSVILEVTKACSPCSRIEEIRPGLLRALAGKRGMLFRVIQGGSIRVGDPIILLDSVAAAETPRLP